MRDWKIWKIMKKITLILCLIFSFNNNAYADLYNFEIKVMDEGIQTLDYEIFFEGKYYNMTPFWINQNKFSFDTEFSNLDSNTIIILKYKGENYKIKNLPTSIIQSAKIEVNFSDDNIEENNFEKSENHIFIVERNFSFKMESWGNILYGNFCWRRNGKYSNSPFVPKSKIFLEKKLSGTPASIQNK